MARPVIALLTGLMVVSAVAEAGFDTIVYSRHNLSASAPPRRSGTSETDIRATGETRICVFCHTPHHSSPTTPLWSRETPERYGTVYNLYNSDTIVSSPQQPFGASKLCLSCHDGTIAMNIRYGETQPFTQLTDRGAPISRIPAGYRSNLSTDLSDDHPISLLYQTTPELKDPMLLPPAVKLEEKRFLQCTSCHDPHADGNGSFLVMENHDNGSRLCVTCHTPKGWETSAHKTGGAFPEVAAAGCAACHSTHNAGGASYLLRHPEEEKNCLQSCHNGSGPGSNIRGVFTSPYRHTVESNGSARVHAAEENPLTIGPHVECADCHNPHMVAASLGEPVAPAAGAELRGVKGVDATGLVQVQEAAYEYEICFRCHAGSNNTFRSFLEPPSPPRIRREYNQSRRFDSGNGSVHPVTSARRGTLSSTAVRSLRAEYQPTMNYIYCTDCHNSDRSAKAGFIGQPNGPHGSTYEHILIAKYLQDGNPSYSRGNYELCFRCHDETFVMSSESGFPLHNSHVQGHAGKEAPCSACHDPHGVFAPADPDPTRHHGHLINFDTRYAGANASYDSYFRSCTVACHATQQTRQY